MMSIEFTCNRCAKLLRVPAGSGGKVCRCPACGESLEIPGASTSAQVGNHESHSDKLNIPCPKCKHLLRCAPNLLGSKGQCRNCDFVFTIQLDTATDKLQSTSASYVFDCPKCKQLFEGSAAMQGRRGKCHACGEVFAIELRTVTGSPQPARPIATPPQPGTVARPIASQPIQRPLDAWERNREKARAVVVSSPTQSSHTFQSELPSSPDHNPFAVTSYSPYAGHPVRSRTRATSSSAYTACGILLIICAGLTILFMIYMVISALTSSDRPVRGVDPNDPAYQIGRIVGVLLVAFLPLVLAILELLGGIAFIRQRGLWMARIGAIAACIPCVCLVVNLPFGIWACVLAFGKNAPRDFR